MEIKFKRLVDEAVLPIRAHKGDAGIDLTCIKITTVINECGQLMLVYHTGLAIEIPEGYVGLLFPRSSIYKKSLRQTNAVGVIDSGYRGEIMAVYKTTSDVVPAIYKEGERFAQLVIVPTPEFTIAESAELSASDRGADGFGSTDKANNNDSAAAGAPEETEGTNAGAADLASDKEPVPEQAAGEDSQEDIQENTDDPEVAE